MRDQKTIRLLLEPALLAPAQQRRLPVARVLTTAAARVGYRVQLGQMSDAARMASARQPGYTLFDRADPFHSRALCLRKTYLIEGWRIENTAERWRFGIARARFRPGDPENAARQMRALRHRVFGRSDPPAARGAAIYVPLQGRLCEQRSFQSCSPLSMVRETAQRAEGRPVLLGLHPNEIYSAEERAALAALCSEFPQLRVAAEPWQALIRQASYIVTQNSAVALAGYLAHVPVILFGRFDAHHIAANVWDLGLDPAFDSVCAAAPEFDRYLHWFFTHQIVRTDRADAPDAMLALLKRRGWALS